MEKGRDPKGSLLSHHGLICYWACPTELPIDSEADASAAIFAAIE